MNNIYNPVYEILNQRFIKISDDVIFNKDYVIYSNLFNLVYNVDRFDRNYNFENYILKLKSEKGNTLKTILELDNSILNWLEDDPVNIITRKSSYRHNTSEFPKLFSKKVNFEESVFRRSNNTYRIGYYSLLERNNDKMYFVLTVKKEYSKYVKLCTLLGEPIVEDCFEFWYDKALVLGTGDIKVMRTLNKIIKELSLIDIPCIEKENILSLFQAEVKFVAPTISGQKEMINNFAEEYKQHELSLIKLK